MAVPAEATAHYEMALGLLAQHGVAAEQGADPIEVALRANEAAIAAGQLHRALALVQEQLTHLPSGAAPEVRALLLMTVASTALLDDTQLDALQFTTEALQLVPDDVPLRARVLAAHARANRARDREEEAWRWATAAADLAARLQLPGVLSDATTTLARLTPDLKPEHASQAEQSLRLSIAQAREAADVAAELRSSHGLATLLYELGRLEEAGASFQQVADRAVLMRRPWAPFGLDGRSLAAVVRYIRGDWDEVLRLVDVSSERPPMLARAMLGGVGLAVAAGRGESAAIDRLPALRGAWEREGFVAVACASAAIDLAGDRGDCARAIEVHDEVVELVGGLWVNPIFQARMRLSGLLLGQLGTAARQAGSAERVTLLERGGELREAARLAAGKAARRGPESQAWIARVEAEHLRLEWLCASEGVEPIASRVMVDAWVAAVEAFESFGHVFETARSRARLAQALRGAGETARADAEAALAVQTARRLGARPLLTELRAASSQALPHDRSVELTAREQEVLESVAQGRSNRQIAEQLFISAKTVSVHVSNILAKLDSAGRTEAVAVARRRGLLGDDAQQPR